MFSHDAARLQITIKSCVSLNISNTAHLVQVIHHDNGIFPKQMTILFASENVTSWWPQTLALTSLAVD